MLGTLGGASLNGDVWRYVAFTSNLNHEHKTNEAKHSPCSSNSTVSEGRSPVLSALDLTTHYYEKCAKMPEM
jgi:hypothetical protein